MSNLETNSVPSDRDLVAALAIAIATHPAVTEALVYDPTRPTEPVQIEKVKLYGGRELTSAGLTLGLFPDSVSLSGGMRGFASEEPTSIAQNHFSGAGYLMTAYFMAQLSYRVVDFDSELSLFYGEAEPENLAAPRTDNLYLKPLDIRYSANHADRKYERKELKIVVLPAEEVLRDWVTIIRYVIRDIRYIKPYSLRSPQVLATSYETATIFDSTSQENLVFHTANIRFKLSYTEGNFN